MSGKQANVAYGVDLPRSEFPDETLDSAWTAVARYVKPYSRLAGKQALADDMVLAAAGIKDRPQPALAGDTRAPISNPWPT